MYCNQLTVHINLTAVILLSNFFTRKFHSCYTSTFKFHYFEI